MIGHYIYGKNQWIVFSDDIDLSKKFAFQSKVCLNMAIYLSHNYFLLLWIPTFHVALDRNYQRN